MQMRSTILAILAAMMFMAACRPDNRIHALIVSGSGDHNAELGSANLKAILEISGRFRVDTEDLSADDAVESYQPDFGRYGLVVLNYEGAPWPEAARSALLGYVQAGGGLVVCHPSVGALASWPEYAELTGLETAADGLSASGAHVFPVTIRKPDHPVTAGMPLRWLHSEDRLYGPLPAPGGSMELLATAYSDTAQQGSGRDEPVVFAGSHGNGRVFCTALGHAGPEGAPAMEDAGYITLLQRGAEWAATGAVSMALPPDLPNAASEVRWPGFRPLSLDELMEQIAQYEVNRSRRHLSDLSERIRHSDGSPEAFAAFEERMIGLLRNPGATAEAKRQICRELSWMGSEKSVVALQELLADPELQDMAAYALQRLQP
jgi:uncharacterized protein